MAKRKINQDGEVLVEDEAYNLANGIVFERLENTEVSGNAEIPNDFILEIPSGIKLILPKKGGAPAYVPENSRALPSFEANPNYEVFEGAINVTTLEKEGRVNALTISAIKNITESMNKSGGGCNSCGKK
jgi:hypothetical protein